jgi:hypothetical protein
LIKEPVFAPNNKRFDASFCCIIINLQVAVFKITSQAIPLIERIAKALPIAASFAVLDDPECY